MGMKERRSRKTIKTLLTDIVNALLGLRLKKYFLIFKLTQYFYRYLLQCLCNHTHPYFYIYIHTSYNGCTIHTIHLTHPSYNGFAIHTYLETYILQGMYHTYIYLHTTAFNAHNM